MDMISRPPWPPNQERMERRPLARRWRVTPIVADEASALPSPVGGSLTLVPGNSVPATDESV